MSTQLQENLADAIIENAAADKPKSAGALLEIAGYDPTTAKASPGRTIEQKGVQEALEVRGFDSLSAKRVVGEILETGEKDESRLKAADMIFKVKGDYAPIKSASFNLSADLKDFAAYDEISAKFDEEMRVKIEE